MKRSFCPFGTLPEPPTTRNPKPCAATYAALRPIGPKTPEFGEDEMLTISISESLAGNPEGWSDPASDCPIPFF